MDHSDWMEMPSIKVDLCDQSTVYFAISPYLALAPLFMHCIVHWLNHGRCVPANLVVKFLQFATTVNGGLDAVYPQKIC